MSDCQHDSFSVKAGIQRLTDNAGRVCNFLAEIEINCMQCGLPFHFLCPDAGLSFTKPTVNVGATMLNAPIAPGESTTIPTNIRFEVS